MQSKNLGLRPFTEKVSRESESFSKGEELEAYNSKIIHERGEPVLVSSLLLRNIGCGQADVCIYRNKQLFLFEVKAKPECISRKQRSRLNRSLEFLIEAFDCSGRVLVINKLPKQTCFLNLNL